MFAACCEKVEHLLTTRYGIRIVTRDVPDPLLGDLDGAEIHIDYAVSPEERLFLLAHLFGHTVQWNVLPGARELGQQQTPPVPEDTLAAVLDYEWEAARYSLFMMHEAGVTGLDQWLADYTASDLAYLSHFYRTGEKRSFSEFRMVCERPLEPLAIPPFTPEQHVFRLDGIVI